MLALRWSAAVATRTGTAPRWGKTGGAAAAARGGGPSGRAPDATHRDRRHAPEHSHLPGSASCEMNQCCASERINRGANPARPCWWRHGRDGGERDASALSRM